LLSIRYTMLSGLALSTDDGKSFHRLSKVPVLDRSDDELYVRSAMSVLNEGETWKAWYVSGSDWIEIEGKSVPSYHLRYLESRDGISWGNQGSPVLTHQTADEYGFGRPWVIREGGTYRMWFSLRRKSIPYRLAYAESPDGVHWTRKDRDAGLDVSSSGWDSESVCFAAPTQAGGRTYLFYNGNNYGETGFGVAVLEE
jgi:hypothetical protein